MACARRCFEVISSSISVIRRAPATFPPTAVQPVLIGERYGVPSPRVSAGTCDAFAFTIADGAIYLRVADLKRERARLLAVCRLRAVLAATLLHAGRSAVAGVAWFLRLAQGP